VNVILLFTFWGVKYKRAKTVSRKKKTSALKRISNNPGFRRPTYFSMVCASDFLIEKEKAK